MPILSDITNVKCGDRIIVQCDNPTNNPNCKGTWEIGFHSEILNRNPFLCLSCAAIKRHNVKHSNPLILTPSHDRICKKPVIVKCEQCHHTREIIYYGKLTEQRTSFLCTTCRTLSWKTNSAILTSPEQRVARKKITYRCEKCQRIFETIYNGKKTEERHPFLCFECASHATKITTWNPWILTPPEQRINKHPVLVQCSECKTIYTYKCYSRKLEKRIPWLCDKCSSRKQGLKNKGHKDTFEQREQKRQMRIGKKHSEETKWKIGEGNKGKIISQEQREAISKRQKGRKLPESHRQNINKSRPQMVIKRLATLKRKWNQQGISGFSSKPQNILYDVVKEMYPDAVLNDHTIIKRRLIDVTIPCVKVAIEYDGWAHFHFKKITKDIQQIKQLHAKGWRTLNYRIYGKNDIYNPEFFKKTVKKFIKSKKPHEWLIVGKEEDVEEEDTEQIMLFEKENIL